MRVIACGTGMPTTRTAQAAACFLVELGNGDKFLFDIGSGSAERISSLQIPYDYLDKIFIGHLHGGHFGAIGELFIGGALMGRVVPLRIWSPAAMSPNWERSTPSRRWNRCTPGTSPDGVTIRSFPAIHAINGSVSYSLEWSGLKFIFGSDTYPNKWFIEYAQDADLVIHECFIAVPDLRRCEQGNRAGIPLYGRPEQLIIAIIGSIQR